MMDLSTELSILNNPFKADKITGINIFFRNYSDGGRWTADVEFENGKTRGSQRFETKGADSFGGLIKEMDSFIKTIK